MSEVDSVLPQEEYDLMLDEVRAYLPAYLQHAGALHRDPLADVRELLRLDDIDISKVVAVHVCLAPEVERFVATLDVGVPHPLPASARTQVVTQALGGAVDWGATVRGRAMAGNDQSLFATKPAEATLDAIENRVLAWVIDKLVRTIRLAGGKTAPSAPRTDPQKWMHKLNIMAATLARAQKTPWLRAVPATRPTLTEVRRLNASRSGFHRRAVAPVARRLLRAHEPDAATIAELVCDMYFKPDTTWRLYELLVALRLEKAFSDPALGLGPRRARLIEGARGAGAFATYDLPDGGTLALTYQGWPKDAAPSSRTTVASRHGLTVSKSRPDILVIRRDAGGTIADMLVLELKASRQPSYLMGGLAQLLSYLGEYPWWFTRAPAAWLVAPSSPAFADAPLDDGPLWIVSAGAVADAATAWMLP